MLTHTQGNRRTRTEQEQSAESSHQNPASPAARPARGGITKGIETLRLEKQHTEATRVPADEDLVITEAPISPSAILAGSREQEPGNRRSRATPQKGGRSGGSNAGMFIFNLCVFQS